MKARLCLLFITQLVISTWAIGQNLPNVTASGSASTNSNLFVNVGGDSVTIDVTNIDKVYVIVSFTSTTNSGNALASYRVVDSSDSNISSEIIERTHNGTPGVGSVIHSFDVSSFSGNRTYVFQHKTDAQTLNTSGVITAIGLNDGTYALNSFFSNNSSSVEIPSTWDVISESGSISSDGGFYVNAVINCQKTSGTAIAVAEWKLQYSIAGEDDWIDLSYTIPRSVTGTGIGVIKLVGALSNSVTGSYKFRVMHRKTVGTDSYSTNKCLFSVISLGNQGGYFPVLVVSSPSSSTTSTSLTSLFDVEFTSSVNTDLFFHAQYGLQSNGTSNAPTHDVVVNKRNTTVFDGLDFYRALSNSSDRGSGALSGLVSGIIGDSLYTLSFRHASTFSRSLTTIGAYIVGIGMSRSSQPLVTPITVYASEGLPFSSFSNLKSAFDNINNGVFRGNIQIKVNSNTTEIGTCLLQASGIGSTNYSSVLIYPTAPNLTISGNLSTPIVHLNGAQNVIFDGRVNQIGGASLSLINQNTGANARAFRFENSAQNNTLSYLNIKGSSISDVIFFANSSSGSGNSNNIIEYSNITNSGVRPGNLIYSLGTAGRRNAGNIIRYNNLFNFLSPDRFSNGINIVSNSEGWIIDNNHFYDSETIIPSSRKGYSLIRISTADVNDYTITNNYFGGKGEFCSGGKWTITSSVSHFMRIISIQTSNSGTSIISNNTIQEFDYTSTSGNPFDAIYLSQGSANIENNVIGSSTSTESIILRAPNAYLKANLLNESVSSIDIIGAGSGYSTAPDIAIINGGGSGATATASINANGEITSVTITNGGSGYTSLPTVTIQAIAQTASTFHGIWLQDSGSKIIRGNTIGAIMTIGSDAYAFGFEGIYENAGFTGNTEISNNIFGSVATENSINMSSGAVSAGSAQRVYGIYTQNDGNTIIRNNTIANITNYYSGTNNVAVTMGILANRGNNIIENNQVSQIKTYAKNSSTSKSASVIGICLDRNTVGNYHSIKNNIVTGIYNLNPDARVDAYGIYFYGSNDDLHVISGNLVQNIQIQSSNIGSSIDGILIYGGKLQFHNNIIHLGKDFTNKCFIYGVWDQSTWADCYYNTILIEGSISGTTSSSFAYNSRPSTSIDRKIKNNLFINTRNGGLTGKHYAIRLGTSSNLLIDYNNYFAPNGVLGSFSIDRTSLTAWKMATVQDVNSYSSDPQFIGIGTNHEPFYPVIPQGGDPNVGIGTDYTGQNRSVTNPKIGALEINEFIWEGGTNSDFNTASNWTNGVVPESGASIRFADVPTNDCVLDQNRILGTITNSSAKNLVLNGKNVSITNNLNFTGAGKIDGLTLGSTLNFIGDENQIIDGDIFIDNILDTLIVNNTATLNLLNDFIVSSQLFLQQGIFQINDNELILKGSIQTGAGLLIGGDHSSITIDGDIPTFSFPEITLKKLSLNTTNGITLTGNLLIQDTLKLNNGNINVNGNILTINGSDVSRIVGSINASIVNSKIIFNNNLNISLEDGFFNANVCNLVVNGGGIQSEGDISIVDTLDLQSGNPNATTGLLAMLNNKELKLLGDAQVLGVGDITGVVSRDSFVEQKKYTFNNKNAYILFNMGSTTLPTVVKVKLTIGNPPTWKSTAISRIYDIIQSGGNNCIATFRASYLDSELAGNTEDKLSLWSQHNNAPPYDTPLDNGKSYYNITENWLERTDVNLMYLPSSFGFFENSLANTELTYHTWIGITSTDWNTASNWSSNTIPTETSSVVIPDAMTTSFSPTLPPNENTIIKDILLEAGSLLNSGDSDNAILSLTHNLGTWSNAGGTFNPGNSTVKFIRNGNSTISGNTQFNNIEISDTTIVTLAAGTYLKIKGGLSIIENGADRGVLRTVVAGITTVDYNGLNQTIVIPNVTTNRYYNLILSGSGTKEMPSDSLNIVGHFQVQDSTSVSASNALMVSEDIIIGNHATFITGLFDHVLRGNFENNGIFSATNGTKFIFKGTKKQLILGDAKSVFNILNINNEFGVELFSDIDVSTDIQMTSGILHVGETTLGINGTITGVNASNTIDAVSSHSTVKYGGDESQIIGLNHFLNNQIYNLVIDNSVGVIQNTDINVINDFTIATSKVYQINPEILLTVNGEVNNLSGVNGFIIKSNSAQANGSFIFPQGQQVAATVQFYSKASWNLAGGAGGKYKWQYFGVPITKETMLKASPIFDGSYIRKYNEAGNGAGTSNVPVKRWLQLTGSSLLEPFVGYEIVQSGAKTYNIKGELVNSDYNSGALNYTIGADYPGQYIFSNPYVASIDIKELVFGSETEASVYQYNTGSQNDWIANSGTYGSLAGQYTVSPQAIAGEAGIPQYIPSMQGFLVQKLNDNALNLDNFTFNIPYNSVRVKNTTQQRAPKKEKTHMIIDIAGSRFSDKVWIFLNPNCSRDFDNGWDGRKMLGSSVAPQLCVRDFNNDLQISAIDDINNTILAFQPGEDSLYKLTFTHNLMDDFYSELYLIDLETSKFVDISESGSTYTFSTVSSGLLQERFKIVTYSGTTTSQFSLEDSDFEFFAYKQSLIIHNGSKKFGKLKIVDLTGEVLQTYQINDNPITHLKPGLKPGVYIVIWESTDEMLSSKVIFY